jgi:superfamily I DNA and/or RNA helicase
MHPAIADFVGSVFYPEGLHTAVDENERTIAFGEFNRPVCLIPTSAYKDRFEEYLAPGYRNYLEARIVRRVLEKAELELAESQSFGVITPYAHQVDLILRELDTMLPSLQKVRLAADDVASVDSFQGSERDVIVISFVRSPASCTRCEGTGVRQRGQRCDYCDGKGWRGTGLTFARDLRRLNVAFSRARKMLILVGDIDALTDSRYRGGAPGGRVLAMFRDYVRDRGKVLHVWERGHDNS